MKHYNKKSFFKLNTWLLILNAIIIGIITISNLMFEHRFETARAGVLGATIPAFNKNMVVSDTAFRSSRAFPNVETLQSYLTSVDSPLATFSESGKTAAQIIFASARGETSAKWGVVPNLNPGLLLAYLEKEHSLFTRAGFNNQADWLDRTTRAVGYGCPTGGDCNADYYGFTNQMNWASYQLEYNYFLALRTDISDPYKINTTINTLDPDQVFLTNAATAANYRYTPHVYWGNYNLWKIMTSFGWGDSAETYSYAELDRASLNQSTTDPNPATPQTEINLSEVRSLIETPPAIGTTSADVSKLQMFLKQQGFFTYAYITGYYGPITETALNAFKASDKYTTTQVVADTCTSLKNKTWKIGDSGLEVKRLQICMQDLGFFTYSGGATGYFGSITLDALTRWRNSATTPPAAPPVTVTPPPAPAPQPVVAEACASQKASAKSWAIGRTGQDVRDLQKCLQDAGIYKWQHGVTGYFGPYTQGILSQSAPVASSAVCEPTRTQAKSWAIGRTGQDVRDLQKCLQDAGIYKWQHGVTGYFGPYTQGIL